jgi:4-hydroxybenzoate polyprenyltransferase
MRGVLGWVQATHPFPLLAVICLTALIGVASARESLDAGRFATVLIAMLLAQLVIGWTNDYVDREADARYQPSKPVPSGRVDASKMPMASGVAGLGAILVASTLGWAPALCVALGIGAGLAYNLWLKSTPWSWAPFVVAFCVLPPYVWTGLDVWRDSFVALYAVGLPLTVAAHLANALPDIETDRAAGRHSIVVRLGRGATVRLLAVLLGLPVVVTTQSSRYMSYDLVALMAMFTAYGLLFAAAAYLYACGRGRREWGVWGFRMVVAASLVFTGGWLASVK